MIESKILGSLLHDDEYLNKVLPYIKPEYFDSLEDREILKAISKYVDAYAGSMPSPDIVEHIIETDAKTLSDESFKSIQDKLKGFSSVDPSQRDWLVDETEKFCQQAAIFNAIRTGVSILDGDEKKLDVGSIPDLLNDALAVSFDTHVGHDYFENASERFDSYVQKEHKIPFDLDILNDITDDGIGRKTLSILMAPTGVGKSLFMCHMAAANLMHGKNVLYITMEMSEERISERIDANILNIDIKQLKSLSKEGFLKRIERAKTRTAGKLVVKEYPTSTAGAGHFRHLIRELKQKKGFVPDIIYIDYLNICMSTRLRSMSSNVNSYTYVKAIAEEIRGLAVEHDLPIVSATQTNREGFSNGDMDLTNTSESIGLPQTCDLMLGIMSIQELENQGQILVKQLKNRYGDLNYKNKFVIGIERSLMRLCDVDNPTDGLLGSETTKPNAKSKGEKKDSPIMDSTDIHRDDETLGDNGGFKVKRKKGKGW